MKDVELMIIQRDKLFNDQTHIIFERIEDTLDGVRGFLINADPSYEPGTFYWEDVSLFEELLMLVGIVKYKPGDTFILDGEMVEITKDNQNYFDRVLRIGIPLVIVAQNDPDAVYDFLGQLHTAIDEEEALAMDEALQDEYDAELDAVELAHDMLKPDGAFEFDMDELSDAQKEALALHTKNGKVN